MNEPPELIADIYQNNQPPVRLFKRPPQPLPPEKPNKRRKHLLVTIGLLLVAVFAFYGVRGLIVKHVAEESAQEILAQFERARNALIALDIREAEDSFVKIKDIISSLENEVSRFGLLSFAEVIGSVYPQITDATESLSVLDTLSDKVLAVIRTADLLKRKSFDWAMTGHGTMLINHLTDLQKEVAELNEVVGKLKESADSLEYPVGDEALAFRAELYRSEKLLDAAIRWLSGVNHIAVMFTNPSEIRPGGGFPGSYAAITVAKGSASEIVVRDIYDPDGQLDVLVTPPKQLQSITSTWGARDANWFFDFPTSARTTLSFLNESKIYKEQGLEFSALLMVNVNVLSDILDITGPITLAEYNITLDAHNVIDEIQREVRSGADRSTGNPKRILKVLAPLLFEKLAILNDMQKKDLVSRVVDRFTAKDMLAYLANPLMQAYLEQLHIAGHVSQPSGADIIDYLAIANANIGGGKSDAVITQSIDLRSRIDLQGKAHNILEIKRAHRGKNSAATWYNTVNKNFMQVFTPRGSKPITIKGNDSLPPLSSVDVSGYKTNADLEAIEGSLERLSTLDISQTLAFNKTVFGIWSVILPGATETIELQYAHENSLKPSGETDYVFVFDKQPGVETALSLTIEAPPGYKWKENNSPTYTFSTKSADGLIELPLTLKPLK